MALHPTINISRIPDAIGVQVKAYAEAGYSLKKISKMCGVSIETVRTIKASNKYDRALIEALKKGLADKYYRVADKALNAISDSKLANSSAPQLILTAATATDKARLIEGQATARVEFMNAADRELQDEIAQLEGELAAWQNGDIVNAEAEGSSDAPLASGQPSNVESESPSNNDANMKGAA